MMSSVGLSLSPSNCIRLCTCDQREIYQAPACIYKADGICTYVHEVVEVVRESHVVELRPDFTPCRSSSMKSLAF